MHHQGVEGPVPLEEVVDDEQKTVYYTEILVSKKVEDTLPALLKMIARIEAQHRCKAVYRVHSDRAQELTGERIVDELATRGIRVSSTAEVEPNANARA